MALFKVRFRILKLSIWETTKEKEYDDTYNERKITKQEITQIAYT